MLLQVVSNLTQDLVMTDLILRYTVLQINSYQNHYNTYLYIYTLCSKKVTPKFKSL